MRRGQWALALPLAMEERERGGRDLEREPSRWLQE